MSLYCRRGRGKERGRENTDLTGEGWREQRREGEGEREKILSLLEGVGGREGKSSKPSIVKEREEGREGASVTRSTSSGYTSNQSNTASTITNTLTKR